MKKGDKIVYIIDNHNYIDEHGDYMKVFNIYTL